MVGCLQIPSKGSSTGSTQLQGLKLITLTGPSTIIVDTMYIYIDTMCKYIYMYIYYIHICIYIWAPKSTLYYYLDPLGTWDSRALGLGVS